MNSFSLTQELIRLQLKLYTQDAGSNERQLLS